MTTFKKKRLSSFSVRSVFSKLNYADCLAVCVWIISVFLLFDSVKYSIQLPDECAYLTITQRMAQGDRLVIDDWHITQLAAIFQYLPYRCYVALTGGTEGIILAIRRLYVVIELLFFVYIYKSFRKYKGWAVLSAVVFTGYNAFGFLTLNYYTMGFMALLFVGVELLVKQTDRPWRLFCVGFVFACAVLLQPVAMFFYFAYCVFVLIRRIRGKKEGKQESAEGLRENARRWSFLTAGILLCAFLFFLLMFVGVDLSVFFRNFREVFNDSEYDYFTPGNWFRSTKIQVFLTIYGYLFPLLSWGSVLVLALCRKKLLRFRLLLCPIFLALSVAALISVYFVKSDCRIYAVILSRPLFIANVGLVCYLFTEKKNNRMLVFLLSGLLFSFLEDIASEISMWNGSIIAAVPAVILFASLFFELSAERKNASSGKTVKAAWGAVVVLAAVFVAGESWNYTLVRQIHPAEYYNVDPDAQLTEVLTEGPLRGIYTIPDVKEKYTAALQDMDIVKQKSDGPLYIAGECPVYYLYADLPYGVFSTYFVPTDSNERILKYWNVHPEKLPSCIYVPFYNTYAYATDMESAEGQLRFLETLCEFEKTEGSAGYILEVRAWKPQMKQP